MSRLDLRKFLDLVVLTALVVPGCAAEDEALDDDAVDAAVEEEATPLDDRLEIDGLRIVVPPPGVTVWSERIYDDGTMQHVMVHTDLTGLVSVEQLDDDEPPAAADLAFTPQDPVAISSCDDGAYKLLTHKWNKRLDWYFNSGSRPAGMSTKAVETALRTAMSNISLSHNACGFADIVSATHHYAGRKSKNVNIDSDGGCTTADGVNVVGFGDLPEGTLGVACTWSSNGIASESDIKLNKADHKWTTSPSSGSCSNRYSVEAVTTHEAGHAFGLGHVSETTHASMTMSTKISACQNSETTLGRGDVLGLRARY